MNSYPSSTHAASNSGISEVPTHAAAPYILSRRTLRKVLNQALGTPSQFDAFLIDFYPEVFNQTAASMDRETKVNLLLLHVPEGQLTETLRKEYPELVQRQLTASSGEEDRRSKFTVVLSAIIDEMDVHKVYALLTHLRRYTNDSELTIEQLRSGSVIITCTGSRSGFARLHADFSCGRLSHLLGYRIKDLALQQGQEELSRSSYLQRPRPEPTLETLPLMLRLEQLPQPAPTLPSAPPPPPMMGAPVAFTILSGTATQVADARADARTLLNTAYTSRSMGAAAVVQKRVKRSPLRLIVSFSVGALMAAVCLGVIATRLRLALLKPAMPAAGRLDGARPSQLPLPRQPPAPPSAKETAPQTPSSSVSRAVHGEEAVPAPVPPPRRRAGVPAARSKAPPAGPLSVRVDVHCAESGACQKSAAEIITRLCLNRHLQGVRPEKLTLVRQRQGYVLQRRPAALRGTDLEPFVGCVQSSILRLYGRDERLWPTQLLMTPGR